MEGVASVEEIVQADIFLYDIDIVDRSMIGELASRSVEEHSHFVRLLHYNSHICYVSNKNAFFKAYRCPSCDEYIKRAQLMEPHLTTCKKKLNMFFGRMCFNCETHCSTN